MKKLMIVLILFICMASFVYAQDLEKRRMDLIQMQLITAGKIQLNDEVRLQAQKREVELKAQQEQILKELQKIAAEIAAVKEPIIQFDENGDLIESKEKESDAMQK